MTDEESAIPAIERDIVDSVRLFEHDLQLYDELPEGLMNIEDLEKLVIDRLTILSTVEKIAERGKYRSAKRCRRVLMKRLRSAGYESFANLCEGTGHYRVNTEQHYAARRKDHVSHFVLLLGMSQSSISRCWIWRMESFLFAWRLSALDDKGIKTFTANNDLEYPMVDKDDKRRMKDSLKPLMKHPSSFDSTAFYRVPAVEMLRSETRRYIYFKEGFAYAEHSHLRAAILYQYKSRLRSRIQRFIGAHNYMIDPRIRVVVESVQKKFAAMKTNVWNPVVARVDKLDEIAETSYPPCMRKLHEGLRRTHHLRNQGRVQYTLFLKAIGITAEDAVEFYKSEFTKDMDEEAFVKQYTYIFRHLYGLVGAKKSHGVPSCWKMAGERPGPNEYHGCPFATNDIEDLGKLLTGWNVEPASKYDIVGRVMKKDRGKACAGYFAAIHRRPAIYPIVNPKDFYIQSRKLRESRDSGQLDAVLTEPDGTPVFSRYRDEVERLDAENDDWESSERSASSDENDDSDDECRIVGEINAPKAARNYTKLRRDARTAEMRRELVEFYESVAGRKEPITAVDRKSSACFRLTKSRKREFASSRNVGGIKSGISNAVDERSYLDYILEHFKGRTGGKMDED